MGRIKTARAARIVRHRRLRKRLIGTLERPRLCVFRSLQHIYAQIIDDSRGQTLVAVTSLDSELREPGKGHTKTQRASLVGGLLAERAKLKGVVRVVFDRGGRKYHGRVKALAEAAREGGLEL